MNHTRTRWLDLSKRWLAHGHLPLLLAIVAMLEMAPSLKTGLFADDLMQRSVELPPGQLPAGMEKTGNPADCGHFSTVLFDLFGFPRNPQCLVLAKNYGTLPWWTPDGLHLSLCRPVAALTHWLDYRVFPDAPVLMHAHSIAWFAAVVFMVAFVYRELMGAGAVAGLAALLFVLDGYTFFPVMFVANRGFIMALFFGLLYLHEHHRWRSRQSRSALVGSMLFLALAVFAEEGGAAAFAFIVAYALVLESGSWRHRALTVLPSVLVLILWRTIYVLAGYGLSHIGDFYIDPLSEPFRFSAALLPRLAQVLGGQLTGLPPEILFAVKPSLHPVVIALYGACVAAASLAFLPCLRQNKLAAFWFAVMVFAAIPESSLVPVSKNFGFVAIGAYGVIASFTAALLNHRLPVARLYPVLAWSVCALLLLVHIPGAIAGRIVTTQAASSFLARVNQPPRDWPGITNQNVVVLNFPVPLASGYVPGYKAYFHQPLPHTVRALVPGCTGLTVQRISENSLVIQSHGSNLFSCDDLGPAHIAYVFATANLLLDRPECRAGDRFALNGFTAEILQSDASGLPSRVAFHFETSLDSPAFCWLWWNWRTFSAEPFQMPALDQTISLAGPAN